MAQVLQAAQLQRIMTGDKQYPKPSDFHPSYGTAGFRSVADRLPSTVYRYFAPDSSTYPVGCVWQ